jgi:carbamoyltransferase
MLVLGIHGGQARETEDLGPGFGAHDAAAVLVRDNEILAAIEEERITRLKHTNAFPGEAIRFCLRQAGVGWDEVDRVALNVSEQTLDYHAALGALGTPGERISAAREILAARFSEAFGVDVADRLRFCHHHMAHAVSAYFASGFDRSLVVTLDGDGDGLSGMVLVADNGRLHKLKEYSDQISLGNWYSSLINVLGYTRFDEYKVMGLAPLGNPERFAALFRSLYRLLPGGEYEIAPIAEHVYHLQREGLVDNTRKKGAPFNQMHKDFAAALQATLEDIGLHIARHFQRQTAMDKLCLAGGVAHNCSMNGKILYSGLFRKMFVQPAAHDAGSALGAAWMVLGDEGGMVCRRPMRHLYLGSDIQGPDEIGRTLDGWRSLVDFERLEDIEAHSALLLAEGAVIGWVQGRSEFGPRALGNRSILADPRPAENKDLINRMVKKREGYRPFAPSVCEENAGEFFETLPEQADFPFMIFVLNVRSQWQTPLGAITHTDGTARVHTVAQSVNPRYWKLLRAFGDRTGVPMLLNTSFNNNAEPIVDSVEDAVTCYLTTGLHYCVIGDYLVRKRELGPTDLRYLELAPALRPHRKLVRRVERDGDGRGLRGRFAIECTANDFFCESKVQVSRDLFQLLLAADGLRSAASLLDEQGLPLERREAIIGELVDLWSRRAVVLRPAAA